MAGLLGFAPFRTVLFWLIAGLPVGACLWVNGVQYDVDLHYYTRGVLNWEAQHPPLYNFFLAPFYWLRLHGQWIIACQWVLLTLAKVVAFRLWVQPLKLKPAVELAFWAVLAFEPVSWFYNCSLLTEALYQASLLWVLVGWRRRSGVLMALGLAAGFLLRIVGLLGIAYTYGTALFRPTTRVGRLTLLTLPLAAIAFVYLGQRYINRAGLLNNFGRTGFDNTSWLYRPELCTDTLLCRCIETHLPDPLSLRYDYERRYDVGFRIFLCHAAQLEARPNLAETRSVWKQVDDALAHQAQAIYQAHPVLVTLSNLTQNARRLAFENYLSYREHPHLVPVPAAEWQAVDSLAHRLFRLSPPATSSWWVFSDTDFLNAYALTTVCVLTISLLLGLQQPGAGLLLFHIAVMCSGLVPYKLRFVGIYFWPALLVSGTALLAWLRSLRRTRAE